MQMSEIIDKVSEFYRSELQTAKIMHEELQQVIIKLTEADAARGENITLAEYQYLSARKTALKCEIDMYGKYCSGISAVREILMDFGFDTEVT